LYRAQRTNVNIYLTIMYTSLVTF